MSKMGTELTTLNQVLTGSIKSILSVLAVLILMFCVLFEEIFSYLEDRRYYKEQEKTSPGAFPHHTMRLIVFGVFSAFNMTASFLPVYILRFARRLSWQDTELAASIPVTVNIFIIGAASLFCQRLTSKWGMKRLAILSGLSSFAGNALIFIAPNYFAIAAGLVLDGIGVGFMTNAIYILISCIADSDSRMKGLTVYNGAYLSGVNFGVILGSLLAVNFGQRMVFACVAAVWIGLAFVIAKEGNALQAAAKLTQESGDKEKKSLTHFIKDRRVSSFILLIQNPYIVFGSFVFYYVPLFCDDKGYSELAGTLLLLLYAEIPVIFGDRATKFFMKKLSYKSFYLAYLGNVIALMVYVLYPKITGMIAALVIMGVSACFGKAVQQTYYLDLRPVKDFGEDRAIGIYNFTENIGESLGPVVFSRIMFTSSLARGVMPFCGIVALLGGAHYVINRPKDKRE